MQNDKQHHRITLLSSFWSYFKNSLKIKQCRRETVLFPHSKEVPVDFIHVLNYQLFKFFFTLILNVLHLLFSG